MNEDLFEVDKQENKETWLEQVIKDLKGADFKDKLISNFDGIEIQPLYTKEDLPAFEVDPTAAFFEDLEEGEAGAADQNGLLTWNICEEIVVGDTFLNDLVIESLKRGANCMRVRAGNWDQFFNDIRKINYQCTFMLDVDSDLTEENLVNTWREYVGFIGSRELLITAIEFDPISNFISNKTIQHKEKSFNNLAQLFFRLSPHLHDCRLVKVDVSIFEEGTDVVHQLAYALAIASEYFDQMNEREVELAEFIHLISFRFPVGPNYFLEIAKLRAFRILWTNLVQAFIEDAEMIPGAYIHAVATTKHDPSENKHTNLLRTTTEAMSAILGGCDALSILPYDEQDPEAMRLATNIQNILRYESDFDKHRHAASGSFYIESLTTELAGKAWTLFQEIESRGGFFEMNQEPRTMNQDKN